MGQKIPNFNKRSKYEPHFLSESKSSKNHVPSLPVKLLC